MVIKLDQDYKLFNLFMQQKSLYGGCRKTQKQGRPSCAHASLAKVSVIWRRKLLVDIFWEIHLIINFLSQQIIGRWILRNLSTITNKFLCQQMIKSENPFTKIGRWILRNVKKWSVYGLWERCKWSTISLSGAKTGLITKPHSSAQTINHSHKWQLCKKIEYNRKKLERKMKIIKMM